MATVTFSADLGGDGKTYTDDADPDTGLDGVGYIERFVPALAGSVAMAAYAKSRALDAKAFAEDCQSLRNATKTDRQAAASSAGASSGSAQAAENSRRAAGVYAQLAQAASSGQRQGVEIIAHRGFRRASIENTLLALTSCIASGADSIEFDVQVTSDGVNIIYHDDSLNSLTDGSGDIKETASSTVFAAEYTQAVGTAYAGIGIPSFDELIPYLQQTQARFYPEIKGYRSANDIDAMVSSVIDAELSTLCCWQSFNHDDLVRVRQLDPACEVGFLISGASLATLQSHADRASQYLPSSLLIRRSTIASNPSIVRYARDRGVDVGVWTLYTASEREQMQQLGVKRLMCDLPIGHGDA
ncbi:glycerophosphodiester phosphodiesterase [Vreelandella profundi]|uniref:glycerophosphodiester phosphodiesterase n=1 Tax=Vreelandella profundi TaxID=2852117 RepID=UPI001F2D4E5D|nr:glycerophosphodiester phosphodiesterase family protein [Halomonas profundi]